jgi:hypothetical protein
VHIDLITSLTGVSWDEAFVGRITGSYGDMPVYDIGREQSVANKRATGRKKDMAPGYWGKSKAKSTPCTDQSTTQKPLWRWADQFPASGRPHVTPRSPSGTVCKSLVRNSQDLQSRE